MKIDIKYSAGFGLPIFFGNKKSPLGAKAGQNEI